MKIQWKFNWWKFYLFLTEISILDSIKLELFSNLIVYLLINYFGVAWMAVGRSLSTEKGVKCRNIQLKVQKFMPFILI